MLVLSRKVGEDIVIGDSIRITVVEMRGGKVRIGVVAPRDVVVDRKEVHDARQNALIERRDVNPYSRPVEPLLLDWRPLFNEKPRLIAAMKSSLDSALAVKVEKTPK